MIECLLVMALLRDPCDDDLDKLADYFAQSGQHDAELCVRTELVGWPDADMADWYNLAVSLLDAGYPAEGWLYEIAARTAPWDPVLVFTLDMLAEEAEDLHEGSALRAHSNALKELAHGQVAAAQGSSQDP